MILTTEVFLNERTMRAGRYNHCFANNMDENKGWYQEILYICPYLSLYGRNR